MSRKPSAKNIMLAHSKAKVNFYQSYLERYLSIMSVTRYVDTLNIFDVFCGRGEYDDGGLGSPIRAVETIIKIKKERNSNLRVNLFLNDAQKKYVERVKSYIEEHFPDYKKYCNIIFLNYKVGELFGRIYEYVDHTQKNERNFFFIDPYGYKDISRKLLSRLMSNKRTEILLFLPISFMHRFRSYAFNEIIDTKALPLRLFTQQFFDIDHPVCQDDAMDVIEYIDAWKEAFSLNQTYYTTSYFIERDARNYFALFFICNNLLGLEKAVETKWALDGEHGSGFHQEEKKDDGQMDLFAEWLEQEKSKVRSENLRLRLMNFLRQRGRSNAEIYTFILRLGYMPKHANALLREWQNDNVIIVKSCDPSKPVKKGAFYLTYTDSKAPLFPRVEIRLAA